jgi:RNA recognition motif-containing protein
LLSEVGRVVRVHIGTDRETGKSRGFAFAEFGTESEAADAIRRFDGYDLGGRRLRVNNAEDRPARPAGPGFRPAGGAPPRHAAPPSGEMFAAGDPFYGEAFSGAGGRGARGKGSRRGLRARKRSLSY